MMPVESLMRAGRAHKTPPASSAVEPLALPPRSRFGFTSRFLAGGVAILVCATVAVGTFTVGTIDTIAADLALGGKPIISRELRAAADGSPQTILVIGDDHSGSDTSQATGTIDQGTGVPLLHADTFMLVRMDPRQGQTSILSIPRDLMISFSDDGNYYPDVKFNEAYAVGGVDEVLKMIKEYLPGVEVNHVIDFNFSSFIGVIRAIGCVYIDVDQRYYNPYGSGDGYLAINLQPGYHRLCGERALAYVRYRHTDSDFVRVARQADFIRQAKEQLGVLGLLSKYSQIARAFGKAIRTDIRGGHEVQQLLELAAYSLSAPVRHVDFQTNDDSYFVNGEDEVTSTPQLIRQSVDDLLYEDPRASLPALTPRGRHHHHHAINAAALDLYPASRIVSDAEAMSVDVPFRVYVPSFETGTAIPMDFHPYEVVDEQGKVHHGYRIDWSVNGDGGYYGIEGLDWSDPPLFANPTGTETINGRSYMFVDNGAAIQYLGWHRGNVLYWISNTLLDDLTNKQMLAIAESARAIR
ncbi:MAG: LCP family protein [Solirubrobacteraceae bacterium]|jgi:LCP family protein required for cell wall assembly